MRVGHHRRRSEWSYYCQKMKFQCENEPGLGCAEKQVSSLSASYSRFCKLTAFVIIDQSFTQVSSDLGGSHEMSRLGLKTMILFQNVISAKFPSTQMNRHGISTNVAKLHNRFVRMSKRGSEEKISRMSMLANCLWKALGDSHTNGYLCCTLLQLALENGNKSKKSFSVFATFTMSLCLRFSRFIACFCHSRCSSFCFLISISSPTTCGMTSDLNDEHYFKSLLLAVVERIEMFRS